MPTLRQVGIHPLTREKLSSGLKRKRSTAPSLPNTDNCIAPLTDNPAASPESATASASAVSLFVPIRTPSALLSRDPSRLSTDLNTSLRNIHSLRAGVAREIISNPYSGHSRQAADVASEVIEFYCINNDDDGDKSINAGSEQQNRKPCVFSRPKPFISGAITAFDMCAHARCINTISSRCNNKYDADSCDVPNQHHSNDLPCIRTGSDAIDTLLAPDHSYSSFDDGWSMPHPFNLPFDFDNNIDQGDYLNSNRCYSSTSPTGRERGVPFGMVTEFSGPPSSGKTQLVLSIVAHAVMMNGLKVHYISGGNSRKAVARRLFAVFNELARSQNIMKRGQIMTEDQLKAIALNKLDCVHISSVPDAYSLLAVLARINDEEVAYQTGSEIAKKSIVYNGTLLIIDSVSCCVGHHLASDAGTALASQIASTLRYMARTHDGRLCNKTEQEQNYSKMSQLRRFAVVVTNGSVAKRLLDHDPHRFSAKTQSFGMHSQHQPAMGQYWHVSDIGIWLEEDNSQDRDNSHYHQPIRFYDNTPPVALSLADKKIVRATLLNHYGKSCKCELSGHHRTYLFAKFSIRSIGITDVE